LHAKSLHSTNRHSKTAKKIGELVGSVENSILATFFYSVRGAISVVQECKNHYIYGTTQPVKTVVTSILHQLQDLHGACLKVDEMLFSDI
jgi:hypothetical protein